MTFSPEISLGNLFPVAIGLATFIAFFVTVRVRGEQTEKKVDGISARVDGQEKALADHRLHVAQSFVRHDALKELKEDVAKRIDGLSAEVRENTAATRDGMHAIVEALAAGQSAPRRTRRPGGGQ